MSYQRTVLNNYNNYYFRVKDARTRFKLSPTAGQRAPEPGQSTEMPDMPRHDDQPSEDKMWSQLLPPLYGPLDHREGSEREGGLPLLPEPRDH
mgnify:CR=1 FL=1